MSIESPIQGFGLALLGAESTGKSTLAQAVVDLLNGPDRHGLVATRGVLVPEYLRQWCMQHGRTPAAHEQAAVADEHAAKLQQTRTQFPEAIVVADTTPLMVAVYSEHYFGDTSLYAAAHTPQNAFDLTLLLGLDLPWQADGPWRDGQPTQQAVDELLRLRLLDMGVGVGHALIYGQGTQRTTAAWRALNAALPPKNAHKDHVIFVAEKLYWSSDRSQFGSKFHTKCEDCSDPDCERRLFSHLLEQRQGSTPAVPGCERSV